MHAPFPLVNNKCPWTQTVKIETSVFCVLSCLEKSKVVQSLEDKITCKETMKNQSSSIYSLPRGRNLISFTSNPKLAFQGKEREREREGEGERGGERERISFICIFVHNYLLGDITFLLKCQRSVVKS